MVDMKSFTEFWKAMFFFVSTLTLSVFLYLVVFEWQPLWTDGFKNFGSISKAIIRLDRTARPVADITPMILGELDQMRSTMMLMQQSMKTMEDLDPSVKEMTHAMNNMSWIIDNRMGTMNREVDRMGDRMSPSGMMPFNW